MKSAYSTHEKKRENLAIIIKSKNFNIVHTIGLSQAYLILFSFYYKLLNKKVQIREFTECRSIEIKIV